MEYQKIDENTLGKVVPVDFGALKYEREDCLSIIERNQERIKEIDAIFAEAEKLDVEHGIELDVKPDTSPNVLIVDDMQNG